ncbi:hypothetical protein EX30DRAFT_350869 [Ascodesmis nigricans]|uniref:Uncharacterized protein n=1 Tax=Ascodesmis nigricans TaxID=341454 RepID=A0A4S2MRL4_9PEZI|nr:hypothetical protein EX30DRAFT_350869 [Ascodesmis nigricans]
MPPFSYSRYTTWYQPRDPGCSTTHNSLPGRCTTTVPVGTADMTLELDKTRQGEEQGCGSSDSIQAHGGVMDELSGQSHNPTIPQSQSSGFSNSPVHPSVTAPS